MGCWLYMLPLCPKDDKEIEWTRVWILMFWWPHFTFLLAPSSHPYTWMYCIFYSFEYESHKMQIWKKKEANKYLNILQIQDYLKFPWGEKKQQLIYPAKYNLCHQSLINLISLCHRSASLSKKHIKKPKIQRTEPGSLWAWTTWNSVSLSILHIFLCITLLNREEDTWYHLPRSC